MIIGIDILKFIQPQWCRDLCSRLGSRENACIKILVVGYLFVPSDRCRFSLRIWSLLSTTTASSVCSGYSNRIFGYFHSLCGTKLRLYPLRTEFHFFEEQGRRPSLGQNPFTYLNLQLLEVKLYTLGASNNWDSTIYS